MSMYSKETYAQMLDQMLSQELFYSSYSATEENIMVAMKRVLGCLIKKAILKRYSGLQLDSDLNVHVVIVDADDTEFNIILYYGH